jgi:RNA polymerase sigma-70 factor (ECF subfamily)
MPVKSLLRFSQRRELKRLVGKSRNRLYRMAYSWTHDPSLADDLVQQAVCKALASQAQLRDLAAAEAWLFRILSNCLTDHYRARREFVPESEIYAIDEKTPDRMTEQEQLVDRVRRSIAKLPLAQRQVVTLIDLEGFAYANVAQILDIPVGTVMSRLCRGRKALKQNLLDTKPRAEAPGTHLKRVK